MSMVEKWTLMDELYPLDEMWTIMDEKVMN
jgi:hypothetical protein